MNERNLHFPFSPAVSRSLTGVFCPAKHRGGIRKDEGVENDISLSRLYQTFNPITLFLLSNFYKKSACISASASVTPEGLEPSTQ